MPVEANRQHGRNGDQYDAIIIGGGPSGAVAATRLALAGWRVAVVEQSEFPRRKVCGEYLSATNGAVLERLGLWPAFDELAGPEVTRVALFGRHPHPVTAPLPRPTCVNSPMAWGRALTRDRLDTHLLENATRCGAVVLQPWRCVELSRFAGGWKCKADDMQLRGSTRELIAPVVISAHGSWTRQTLPTQPPPSEPSPTDLLGFKAHFRAAALPADLMPLLAFPGGYGGMVNCQGGLVSLSCCIERRVLETLPRRDGATAGERVLRHIERSIPAVREVLAGAERHEAWLAAGPLRPGRRPLYRNGLFAVGNAAGEAHPVVAEGVSMAMQSGWLAADCLANFSDDPMSREAIDHAGARYAKLWTAAFAPRIRASVLIAAWAMRPRLMRLSHPAVRWFPPLLTLGARLSGKARLTGAERSDHHDLHHAKEQATHQEPV